MSNSDLMLASVAIIFVACLLWVLWRLIRALFRPSAVRREPDLPMHPETIRQEPVLASSTVAASASPAGPLDGADIRALRVSIDNLAAQVAALESRLAPPAVRAEPQIPRPEVGDAAPPIVVVPERR